MGNYSNRPLDGEGLSHLWEKIKALADGSSSVHWGTSGSWGSQPDLIGKKGHIYIYSDREKTEEGQTVPGIKVGDGKAYLIDSPFVTALAEDLINSHISDSVCHITSDERAMWDTKVSCHLSEDDAEKLIFTTD